MVDGVRIMKMWVRWIGERVTVWWHKFDKLFPKSSLSQVYVNKTGELYTGEGLRKFRKSSPRGLRRNCFVPLRGSAKCIRFPLRCSAPPAFSGDTAQQWYRINPCLISLTRVLQSIGRFEILFYRLIGTSQRVVHGGPSGEISYV